MFIKYAKFLFVILFINSFDKVVRVDQPINCQPYRYGIINFEFFVSAEPNKSIPLIMVRSYRKSLAITKRRNKRTRKDVFSGNAEKFENTK